MLNQLFISLSQEKMQIFFNCKSNLHTVFNEGTLEIEKAYEDRIRDHIVKNLILSPQIISAPYLSNKNTVPEIIKTILPDVVEQIPKSIQGKNYLKYTNSNRVDHYIKEYCEFGHNFICQDRKFPANKVKEDFIKIIKSLPSNVHFDSFIHVMIITDPLKNIQSDMYGIKKYVKERNIKMNEYLEEIRKNIINTMVKFHDFRIIFANVKSIDYPKGDPNFTTHFIISEILQK